MSKAESFLISVMAPPSCRSAASRPEAGQDLKSGATGSSSQQALGKEASSSSCSSPRAHTEPCRATSPTATIPYGRPPATTPTSTTAPRLERSHRWYVRLITPVFAVLLALTVSPAWAQTLTFSRALAQTDAWTISDTSCDVVEQRPGPVYTIAMSGTITAHIDLRSIRVIGDVDGDVIGFNSLSDMEAGESQDFHVEGLYSGSLEGVRCGYEVNAVGSVPTAPDLVADTPTVSDNRPVAGASITLSTRVRNRGDGASGSTTLRLYRSTNASISTSDTELKSWSVAALPAGGRTVLVSHQSSAPSSPGTYYYGACVEAVSGESDTGNNCSSSVAVTVPAPAPDLVADTPTVSDNSPVAGASITLSTRVRNRGDGASGSTTLRLYRSTNASISTSDTELKSWSVAALPAGGRTVLVSHQSSAPSSPGTYYYGACVEAVSGESDTGNNCSSSVAVTVPAPAPDLVADTPTVSDNSPVAGASITLSTRVRNRGDGASGSTTLRLYRSTNASISTSDTELKSWSVAALPAGGRTVLVSHQSSAPSSPGTYYYGACVEAVSGESDTGNNCSSSVAVTVPAPAPDLVADTPTVSDNSPAAGASFTLETRVLNRGDGASGPTTLRLYRSTDASISTSDTELKSWSVGAIRARGASVLASHQSSAPSSPGTYYYGACVDAVSGESDTGNNCSSSVTVTVSPVPTAPDLVVGSPTVSDNRPVAGASFTLETRVLNRGDGASGSTTLRYYRSTDASISSSDTEVGTDAVGGLAASATSDESISLTAPSAGTYYYGACVEAVTGESDTGNNCSSSVQVTVSPVPTTPDLVVGSPTVSDNSPVASASFTLSATVRNQGNGASGSTTLRYYRSTDASISSSDTEVGTDAVSGLSASGTSAESISLTAPSAGTYYYGACVAAVTGESDTGNNCSSSVQVTVSPVPTAPDLVVGSPTVSDNSPVAGASFTLSATVRNRGDGASGSTTLRYYRSTDASISSSDTEVGTDAVGGLAASATSDESIDLTAPSAGTYYYGACVAAVTGESDTGNNCSSSVAVTVHVSPVPTAPDLVVGSPTASDNRPVAGASFTLSATVRNRGSGASRSTTLRYYRSTDASITTSDTEVGTDQVSGLSASGSSDQLISLTAPSVGTYYYGACVAAVTGESDTGNNCSSSVQVTVSPVPTAPDLVVGSPTVSDNRPVAGASFTLSATVRNRGDGASGSTTLRYYRSTDASISSSDTEVGTDAVGGLAASATSDESIDLTAPSAGTYYYGACVEAVTGESDTGNNCSSSVAVTVHVSPVPTAPDLVVGSPTASDNRPVAGASFTLSATVRNRGSGASRSTTLRYYRSTDASITTSDTEVGTDQVSGLSASGSSDQLISLTAPSVGTYYYGACVEAVTGESDTGNNCSSSVAVTVHVSPVPTAPDLVVGSPTVSDNRPVAGASFTLSATVRNRGSGASGSTTLRYYRSTDASISSSDTEVGTDQVSGLSASGSSDQLISLTAPSAGTYYYGACVEAVTGESATGNNCSSSVAVTVHVSPVPTAPDLVVGSPTVSDNRPVAGASFTLSATVRNQGDGGSGSTTLRYYRSTDASITTSDTEVGTDQVSGLSASGSSDQSISLTAPSAGTYYYGACVDAVAGESATGNNCSSIDITITALLPPEVVSIPDANLASVVRETLDLTPGDAISQLDMLRLGRLEATGRQITDLTGLEYAVNLKELLLGDNQISDITPLAESTIIEGLELYNNNISDISSLAAMTNLTSLYLWHNSVSDLSPLAELNGLTSLQLVGNLVSDLSPLVGLTSLTELDLRENLLSYPSINTYIPAFQSRGVTVQFDMRTPTTADISGDGQAGTPGSVLAEPLGVEVQDENEVAFAGVPVTFAITAGGGTLSVETAATHSSGRAASTLTLGSEPGTNTVEVTVAGLEPLTFTATAKATPDFDGDGVTSFADFFLFADAFGSTNARFDLDGSGVVDFGDFFIFADALGRPARAKLLALAAELIGLPEGPQLQQNAPNPFNSETVLSYFLVRPGLARMEVFALTGQRVAVLRQGPQQAGLHRLHWDGRDAEGRSLASGIYLYRLVTAKGALTRKMILLR